MASPYLQAPLRLEPFLRLDALLSVDAVLRQIQPSLRRLRLALSEELRSSKQNWAAAASTGKAVSRLSDAEVGRRRLLLEPCLFRSCHAAKVGNSRSHLSLLLGSRALDGEASLGRCHEEAGGWVRQPSLLRGCCPRGFDAAGPCNAPVTADLWCTKTLSHAADPGRPCPVLLATAANDRPVFTRREPHALPTRLGCGPCHARFHGACRQRRCSRWRRYSCDHR